MMKIRWLVWLTLVPALVVPAASVCARDAADEAALAQVPAEAPVVICLRGVERTKDRLVTMIKNAVPDLAPVVQAKVDEAFKAAMKDRELKGVPKNGPIFVALTEMPETAATAPPMAIIVRVTNYAEFRDGILKDDERKALKTDPAGYESTKINDEDVYLVDRKGYAVLTPQKDVAIQFTKKQDGLDSKIAKETAKKLLESDAAVYVDMTAVNKKYGDQMKQFRQLIPLLMEQVSQSGQVDKSQLEMIKRMTEGIFQLVEDSQTFLVAADFRPEGLSLRTQVSVGADSKSNALLKNAKPTALEDLAKMPANHLGYVSMEVPPELLKALQPIMTGFMSGPDGKPNKAIAEALDKMIAAGPQTLTMDFSMPMEGMQIWKYDDPNKAAQAQLELLQAFDAGGNFQNAILKAKPKIKENDVEHRGFKLSSASMVWDLDKMMEKAPGGKEMVEAMKKLLGEGANSWFGTDGKVYVQITAKDWDSAKRQLDEYLDGSNSAGQHKPFQETWKQLPSQTTVVGLIDLPQYVQIIAEFVGPAFKAQGLPVNIPHLKASKGKTYLGIAVILEPTRGSLELWIPGTTANEIYKMVQPAIGQGGVE
jgi:hypothetical protein